MQSHDSCNLYLKRIYHFCSSYTSAGAGVLQRLLEVQRFDQHDIEGIHTLYQSLLLPQPGIRTAQSQSRQTCSAGNIDWDRVDKMPVAQKIAATRDYLIAATAKDCSIMMAFRQAEKQSADLIGLDDQLFTIECSVHLADLDFKSLSKVPAHFALDQEILQHARD